MDVIKTLQKIAEIRQEVLKVSDRLDHLQNELDHQIADMIEFLKQKGIIEMKS